MPGQTTEPQPTVTPRQTPDMASSLWADLWLYVRYHIVTKVLLLFGVLPVIRVGMNTTIASVGKPIVGRDDLLSLAFSPQGIVVIVLLSMFVVLAIATEISAFIIMEATRVLRGGQPGVFATLGAAIRASQRYFVPSTVLLIAYMGLIVPLSGVGLSIGPLRQFALPVDIQEVIQANSSYSNAYAVAVIGFMVLSYFLMFTFHYILLDYATPWQGMTRSMKFMWINGLNLAKETITRSGKTVAIGAGIVLLAAFVLSAYQGAAVTAKLRSFISLIGVVGAIQANGVLVFILLPLQIRNSTQQFITYHTPPETDETATSPLGFDLTYLPERTASPTPYPKFFVTALLLMAFLGNGVGFYTSFVRIDDVIVDRKPISIIANHRENDLGVEPSIQAITESIQHGATGIVVDARNDGKGQWGLADGTALPIVTQVAKGQARVFVVLPRHITAHDSYALIDVLEQESTLAEATLLSTDYSLLADIHRHNPTVSTGYIADFALGDLSALPVDTIVIERFNATEETLKALKTKHIQVLYRSAEPPKELALTVPNEVDGLITNHPKQLREAFNQVEGRSPAELLITPIRSE